MAKDGDLRVSITANVDDLKKGLVQADKGIKTFGKSTETLGKKQKAMTGQLTKGTVPALTSFSQVVQDAPFGIRGVANNIQQLTMQMGHLSTNAGGVKNALKSMVGALAGPAGILLAVSLVTTLMVSFGEEMKNFIKGTSKAKKEIERLTKSLENLDTTLSRLKIKKKLAEIFGQETIQLDAKVLQGLKDKLKLQERQLQAAKDAFDIAKQDAETWGLFSSGKVSNRERKGLLELKVEYEKFATQIDKTKISIQQLEEALSGAKGAEVTGNTKVGARQTIDAPEVAGFGALEQTFKDKNPFQQIIENLRASRVALSDELIAMKLTLHKFNEDATKIIETSLADTFMGLGTVIGEALSGAGNSMENAGALLLGGMATLIINLGKMAVATGVTLLGIKTALETLNPYVAIGAGIALIALGTAFKKGAGELGASMGGSGGSSGYSSADNSSFSGSSFGSSSSGYGQSSNVVFEIQGTKLVGVIRNTLKRNSALGGAIELTG